MKFEYSDSLINQLKKEQHQIKNKKDELEHFLYNNNKYDKQDYNTYKFLEYLEDSLVCLKQYYNDIEHLLNISDGIKAQEYLKSINVDKLLKKHKISN